MSYNLHARMKINVCLLEYESDSVSFAKFIDMILAMFPDTEIDYTTLDIFQINRHYRPFVVTCQPCDVKYDYIVKMETMTEEMR